MECVDRADGSRLIQLATGQFAIVDQCDYQRASTHAWSENKRAVMTNMHGKHVLLHRWILGVSATQVVDHINGNPLDNRRSNLRLVTAQQNAFNSSKKRGVSRYKGVWLTPRGKWAAMVAVSGKKRWLGEWFRDEVAAASAYDRAARELHGEYACVNFPNAGERRGFDPEQPTSTERFRALACAWFAALRLRPGKGRKGIPRPRKVAISRRRWGLAVGWVR